jgi:hypothetical protein
MVVAADSHAPSHGAGEIVSSTRIRLTGGRGARRGEPITIGVPFARGACVDPTRLGVIDARQRPLPIQVRVLDCWSDGSIRWALLDAQVDSHGGADGLQLVVADSTRAVAPTVAVTSRAAGEGVEIDSGVARFQLAPGNHRLIQSVVVDGSEALSTEQTGLTVETREGPCIVRFETVMLEETGPLRTVAYARGRAVANGATVVEIDARVHVFAGSPTVRLAITLRNPKAAAHPGGYWELGDAGSVYLRDVAFSIGLADAGDAGTDVWCSEQCGDSLEPAALPFEIYQESSGGVEWQHPNHRTRDGVVPMRWRGYRVRRGGSESNGARATPIVELRQARHRLTVSLPSFWQNFPKAIEASATALTVRLFPAQFGDLHELQGGEQKTHTFFLACAADRVSSVPLEWCRSPLRAALPPSWYCVAGALPYLTPETPASPDDRLMAAGLDPKEGFFAKREIIDEYGWRNFGELYADHEAVFRPNDRIVSHYNNQYDAVAGFAAQFMRTGDSRWWELMDDLARHVVDIDIYHTKGDKSAYNGALFWHTSHYVDAGLSTHRSYPRAPRVGGGGPSNEHNYTTGLILHYYLTGDPQSRAAALDLANWVIDMDDGSLTVFRWLARGATGLASQTSSADYHGPGRGAGHSIRALLDGHRLTGEPRFLRKAEELIRRVVHPSDDLPARHLLDAERRWSYTACLQAVGGYLDYKAERGELDRMYAYARASLLHYARWMADHEYPYLEKPEILEFPTETWAAQDLRKADVFYFAARHTSGADRRRYLERGAFFFHAAVQTLSTLPTRTLTRPLVLLLSHGRMHAWVAAHGLAGDEAPPPVLADQDGFGFPERFTPQKLRAKERFAMVLAAIAAAIIATGVFLAS